MNNFEIATPNSIRLSIGGRAPETVHVASRLEVSGVVQIVVVFDTTGSMDSFIEPMVNCVSELADGLQSLGVKWEATVVPFGDLLIEGDVIDISQAWVNSCRKINRQLATMTRNRGGGNGGESSFEAVEAGLARLRERPMAPRVLVLITDDAPHTRNRSASAIADQLVATDAVFFAVSPDLLPYRQFADVTGGAWVNIHGEVSAASLAGQIGALGSKISERVHEVLAVGGSAQRLLSIEEGR
jgi:hypothetical protein